MAFFYKRSIAFIPKYKGFVCVRITSARGRDSLKQQHVPSVTQSKFRLICKEKSLNGFISGATKSYRIYDAACSFLRTRIFGPGFLILTSNAGKNKQCTNDYE